MLKALYSARLWQCNVFMFLSHAQVYRFATLANIIKRYIHLTILSVLLCIYSALFCLFMHNNNYII